MMPQVHDGKLLVEAQGPTPVENKPTGMPLQERSEPAPASSRRWRDLLMPILGVALPLVAGSMIWWPWGVPDIFDAGWVLATVVLGMVLSVIVGAFLLRSAWALLIVPVAWIGGEMLAAVLRPLVEGGWPALQAASENHLWDAELTLLSLAFTPLILCALLGTAGGIAFDEWLKKRAPR
jgi:hypothetical protein